MRVPVHVTNPHPYPLSNAPVALELDIAKELANAGWTSRPSGARDILSGFRLDPASVHVVAMTNLQPADNFNGKLRAVQPHYPVGDLRRNEVPSIVVEGSLSQPGGFDPVLEPRVTVLWRVEQTLAPGGSAHFVVYFDSDLTTPAKQPSDLTDTLAHGDISSLFWSGPGVQLFGYVAPPPGQPGKIFVTALHDDTDIVVRAAAPGKPWSSLPDGSFTLQRLGTSTPTVTTAGPVLVSIQADKPIIAQGVSSGSIPATDGGMTGRDFVFQVTHGPEREQDTLYVKAVGSGGKSAPPTTLRVTPVAGGSPLFFETGTAANPLDYTVGPRGAFTSGGASCRTGGYASPLLPLGPGTYHAEVIKGERVALRLLAVGAMDQVPSSTGAPAGTDFWAPMTWTDDQGTFADGCQLSLRKASWIAMAEDGSAAHAVSPELGFQVSPPGQPNPPAARFPPPYPVPESPASAGPFEVTSASIADRPIHFQAQQPMHLFAGNVPMMSGTTGRLPPLGSPSTTATALPQIHGPLGGDDAGRSFQGIGRFAVVAPFANTQVEFHGAYPGGTEDTQVELPQGAHRVFDDRSPSQPLQGFGLRASVPVMVLPLNKVSSGFFAAVPPLLATQTMPAEYRGYLIDLRSMSGLDPLTGSTAPGQPVTYTLELVNKARSADGAPLPDTVQVTADLPDGWTATLDGSELSALNGKTVPLAGGQSAQLELVVEAPASAASGDSGKLRLRATSQGNALVTDQLEVVTFVKTVFDVGLWFDGFRGPKTQEDRELDEFGRASFQIFALNMGSRTERVRFTVELKGGQSLWGVALGPEGKTSLELDMEPNTPTTLPLVMTAPESLIDGEATAVVTAFVVASPASADAVQAIALRTAPSELRLETARSTVFTDPGTTAFFELTVHNDGDGGASLTLDARAESNEAWTPPRVLIAGQPVEEIAVAARESIRLQVATDAAADGTAGAFSNIRFGAHTPGAATVLESILDARIRAVHDIEVTWSDAPRIDAFGGNQSIELRLQNNGNLDEVLRLAPLELPRGWTAALPEEVLLPRGATQAVEARLVVPPNTAAGDYHVRLRLVSQDGNVTTARVPVAVGTVGSHEMRPDQPDEVQPGQWAQFPIPLTNDGNAPLTITFAPTGAGGWELDLPGAIGLAPGQSAAPVVRWKVPRDAFDGPSTQRALVVTEGVGSQVVEAAFRVGRADLVWGPLETSQAPAGTLVRATLDNVGERTARDFRVVLMAGDEVVDEARVGSLLAGGSAQVALLHTGAAQLRLLVDHDDAVVELDEKNNARLVDVPASERAAPWGMLLAPVAAALFRRRLHR